MKRRYAKAGPNCPLLRVIDARTGKDIHPYVVEVDADEGWAVVLALDTDGKPYAKINNELATERLTGLNIRLKLIKEDGSHEEWLGVDMPSQVLKPIDTRLMRF